VTIIERRVRAGVFRHFADHGVAPSSADLTRVVSVSASDVRGALRALATAHLLVLDESGRIEMAGPFAGIPTPFRLTSGDRSWWGNCAWDALAIPPLVGVEATLSATCPDCGEAIELVVGPDEDVEPAAFDFAQARRARPHNVFTVGAGFSRLGGSSLVVHYVVPASRWWDDIRHT
jgi:hypothetical protein